MSNSNTNIILAGAAAAFTIDLLIYPLDTIKTRYQSQDYLHTYAKKPPSTAAKQASSTVFRGLYQGVGSVIVATLPAAGLFFTTYESSKTFYAEIANRLPLPNGDPALPTPLVHALASGTAELASCLVLTPAEVIKQNAQMLRDTAAPGSNKTAAINSSGGGGWRNSTSIQALRMVASQSPGARGGAAHRLLTGYGALAARNLPFTALQFPIFEAVRRRLWERRDDRGGPVGGGGERKSRQSGDVARGLIETGVVNGASAAVSGAVAAVVTTPMDVVKTRTMLSAGEDDQSRRGAGVANNSKKQPRRGGAEDGASAKHKRSGWQVARLVYQERGLRGLFRGGLLRASWTAVGSSLYLGTYEVAKVWLRGTDGGDGEVGDL